MKIFQPLIFIGRNIFLAPKKWWKKPENSQPLKPDKHCPLRVPKVKILGLDFPHVIMSHGEVTSWCAPQGLVFRPSLDFSERQASQHNLGTSLRLPMVRKHQPAVVTRKSKGVFETPHTKPKHPSRKSRSYKTDGTKFSQITWDRNKNGGNSFGWYLPSQPDGQIPSITFSRKILTK